MPLDSIILHRTVYTLKLVNCLYLEFYHSIFLGHDFLKLPETLESEVAGKGETIVLFLFFSLK